MTSLLVCAHGGKLAVFGSSSRKPTFIVRQFFSFYLIFTTHPSYIFRCCLSFLVFFSFYNLHLAKAAEIYCVQYSPLMIQNSPDLPGFAVEIIQEAERRMGEKSSIRFYPFARMQKTLLHRKMAIFPCLFRTPQREKSFLWIARVFRVENAFQSIGKPINTLEEAKKLKKVGVVAKTALHGFLQAKGLTNLDVVSRPELNAQKLAAGRIDAWFLTTFLARKIWKQEVSDIELLSGKPIFSPDVYIAANINFPPDLAAMYQKTIDEMHEDGAIQKIVSRYGFAMNEDKVIFYP